MKDNILKNFMNKKMMLIFILTAFISYAQQVQMYFPRFSGKTYDFMIFQGANSKTLLQGTIPADGKFTLTIPEEYKNYTGMSRWLITNTAEGGGLDMFIPGHDFSVSCESAVPNDKNIIYIGNNGNKDLNSLYKEQEIIRNRFNVMEQATKVFPTTDKNYSMFKEELQKQQKAYAEFQNNLRKRGDYISQLISVINISNGAGTILSENRGDIALNILNYMINSMDWNSVYTTGYWNVIIDNWVIIHTEQVKDIKRFVSDYQTIIKKLNSKLEAEFSKRVAYTLDQNKSTEYIKALELQKKN
ncbi:TPA: alkyl hydroperoxide reductase [Elizabethkingia anophelis]